MQSRINIQKRKQSVDKARCFAVMDFVFIFPKTTAPACTISCREEALYDLSISDIFIAIYSLISG